MQTSHNDPTTEATTAPTLAELLAARAIEIEEAQRERAQRDEQERQRAHLDARSHAAQWVDECLTPQLAAALRVQIGVDEKILATDNDDYDPAHLAGYIELAALEEEQETERRRRRWFIRLELHPLKGYYQTLHGPNAYTVLLPSQRYHGARLDDALLDAIDAYTEWMSHAEQRAEEQRRKQAEREEQQAKQPEPRHFTSIAGGQAGALLDRGNRVRVHARNPDAEGGTLQFAAGVETSSDTWLLLNVGTTQRLVPVAQVIDITPLPDLAPDLAPSDAQ